MAFPSRRYMRRDMTSCHEDEASLPLHRRRAYPPRYGRVGADHASLRRTPDSARGRPDRRTVRTTCATAASSRRHPRHVRRTPVGGRHCAVTSWSVQDVITHLITTNQFWTISITSGLAGNPTRYLASFDPVATPAQMVDGMRAMTPSDVLARYVDTVDALADVVDGLDGDAWSTHAEAPPGHIAIRAARPPRALGRVDPRTRHRPAARARPGGRRRRGRGLPAVRRRARPSVLRGDRLSTNGAPWCRRDRPRPVLRRRVRSHGGRHRGPVLPICRRHV